MIILLKPKYTILYYDPYPPRDSDREQKQNCDIRADKQQAPRYVTSSEPNQESNDKLDEYNISKYSEVYRNGSLSRMIGTVGPCKYCRAGDNIGRILNGLWYIYVP